MSHLPDAKPWSSQDEASFPQVKSVFLFNPFVTEEARCAVNISRQLVPFMDYLWVNFKQICLQILCTLDYACECAHKCTGIEGA